MHPVIFGIIKSYGLTLAISFVVGIWLAGRRGAVRGVSRDVILDIGSAVLISSLIGVRLFYIVTHPADFSPWYRIFFLWDGGLTLYGGIITAIVAIIWMARRNRISFLLLADIHAPSFALGIGITRIGCFLSGCCFGKPTECAVGIHFPATAAATRCYGDVAVLPTQLYASAGGFLIFLLLLLAEKRQAPAGATLARFLFLYGLSRFVVDFWRYYEPDQIMALGWSNNQWISVGMMIGGAALLVLLTLRQRKSNV